MFKTSFSIHFALSKSSLGLRFSQPLKIPSLCDISVQLTLNKRMLVIVTYFAESGCINCSISSKAWQNERKFEFLARCMYRICFQAAMLTQNTISTCCVCYLQRKLREIQVNRPLNETCREIYSTQLKSRKKLLFCRSTEKYIHKIVVQCTRPRSHE